MLFSVEMEGLVDPENKLDHGVPHQCIPLYSLLIALGSPTINYFRLIEIDTRSISKIDGVPYQCIPLYSLLIALGSLTINYFRLIEIDS